MNIDELIKSNDFEKLSSKFVEKVLPELFEAIRYEIETFALEQYDNIKDKIERDLISQIANEYNREPDGYKFQALRRKMFLENKDAVLALMVDEVVEQNLEKILLERCDDKYYFKWQWMQGVANFILKNFTLFEGNQNFEFIFKNRIQVLEDEVARLRDKLNKYEDIEENE